MLQGFDGFPGLADIITEIDELHSKSCSNFANMASDPYSFYSCLGLEQAFDQFLNYTKNFFNPDKNLSLKHSLLVHLHHFLTSKINYDQQKSREIITDYLDSYMTRYELIIIILFILSILLLVIGLILKCEIDSQFEIAIKTEILLSRHLPPLSISSSPDLLNILIINKSRCKRTITTFFRNFI
jgi:hypothetical protein